ncbi:MAG: DUF2284 domain-containing protein [Oscillospiraceae bacterium]|nr:DUF2284 domain-containing protein [Oscillospiraceae bacterium]
MASRHMEKRRILHGLNKLNMNANAMYSVSTPSGKKEIILEIAQISPCQVECYTDKKKFDCLCESGCPNYQRKWSCPPYAPDFNEFVYGWESMFVVFMHIEMIQFGHIKNNYLKIKAANATLKSRIDRFLRQISRTCGCYISTGSCRLCKPCKCKNGGPCAHPELMTYSFEAMGVDVGGLTEYCFHKPLLWYKPNHLPEYTSVVCGLLTNSRITVDELEDDYAKINEIIEF